MLKSTLIILLRGQVTVSFMYNPAIQNFHLVANSDYPLESPVVSSKPTCCESHRAITTDLSHSILELIEIGVGVKLTEAVRRVVR